MQKVEGECWTTDRWKPMSNGYVMVRMRPHTYLLHRIAYEAVNGPIPEGLVIDHLCRNPGCHRPSHLEAVTRQVNNQRGLVGRRSGVDTCGRGHDLNQGYRRRQGGTRVCRQCHLDWSKENYRRKHPVETVCAEGHQKVRDKRGHYRCSTCIEAKKRANRQETSA